MTPPAKQPPATPAARKSRRQPKAKTVVFDDQADQAALRRRLAAVRAKRKEA